ncbi:MAG: T9SS type A sorting domain-containing protein, partial [Fibrobacter sp.]|nr:T9SS type A sorting domain-containing protein [Fibrobacter sp.]
GQMYNLDGTLHSSGNETCIPTFLGPLTCAGMVDNTHSTWLNNGYTRLRSYNAKNDNYYNECLELLSMLLLTGNMVDFTKVPPRATATITANVRPAGAGTVTLSPQKDSYGVGDEVTISTSTSNSTRYTFVGWEGDLTGTQQSATFKVGYNRTITAVYRDEQANDLLDDCEDNDGLTNLGTEWFTYTDVLDGGKSTVTPLTKTGETLFKMTEGGYNSSKYAVKVNWTLDKGSFDYDPFVGVGFELAPKAAYTDISKSTGISFFYKGTFGTKDTCDLKIECGAVTTPGADFCYNIPSSTSWKEVNIKWSDFKQPWWVKGDAIATLDLKRISKIQWQIHGQTTAASELWIDDVHILGLPIEKTAVKQPVVSEKIFSESLRCVRMGANLMVNYSLSQNGNVSFALYNIAGKMVKREATSFVHAGNHTAQINLSDIAKGAYLLKLSTETAEITQQIMVSK